MKKQIVILCACFGFCLNLFSQDITHAEYFIDVDPGPGNATNINGFPTNDTLDYSFSIPTTGLSKGFHTLGVRVKNASGVWSHYEKRVFYLITGVESANITEAEYFIDTDPGPGSGIEIIGLPTNDTLGYSFSIPTTGLTEGFHTLIVRVKNETGVWGIFEKRMFYVNLPASIAPDIIAAEYFVNSDPGPGSGTPIALSQDDTLSTLLNIDIPESTSLGTYNYGIRVKNAHQRWSLFSYDTLTVAFSLPRDTIVSAGIGSCSRIVTMIDAETINDEPYTYMLSGATSGSGNGSASGLSFNAGITTVTYALLNNPAISGSFTVTVLDNELPSINCPGNIASGTDNEDCGGVVNYNVSYNDNCPNAQLTLVSGLPSGSLYPTGITTNIFRVTDASGHSATCSFTVTISDDDPQSITCPSNITMSADAGVCSRDSVALGSQVSNDNCGIATVSNDAPSVYPVGTTNVIWIVTDVNGLTASCNQTVTIIDDQPPSITCPSDIFAFANTDSDPVVVNYDPPVFSDNCPGASVIQTTGFPSGSLFSPGTTINTFIVTDANGLTASCSFSVTVRVGRVGVNTIAPLAMLHVVDSSVLFSGPATLSASPSPLPTTGSSARLLWYPDKAAWRSGFFEALQWDKDSVGTYSFAINYNTTAKGVASSAFGFETVATGDHSFAAGNYSVASGLNSISIGFNSLATGEAATSIGFNSTATGFAALSVNADCVSSGDNSFSSGQGSLASGNSSFASGLIAQAIGDYSACLGSNTIAKAFSSFSAGRLNDMTALSTTDWNPLDPLFIIGNGAPGTLKNAMTVLKNGNLGLQTLMPEYRLHVTNNNVHSGGMNEGILIENINPLVGEAGISFRIKSIPVLRKWIIGQNQGQTLDFDYHNSFVIDGMKMKIDTMGFVGIHRLIPKAPLHVVRSDTSGGPYSSNAAYLFESNLVSYLQLSSLNDHETGLLSGNQTTTLRSAILFSPDSSMHFVNDDIQYRMSILKNGNAAIGSTTSGNKLYVAGSTKIGTNGIPFEHMIKGSQYLDIPLLQPGMAGAHLVELDTGPTGTVFISPEGVLPQGLILTAQVLPQGIQIRFVNGSNMNVETDPMNFYFVHIY